MQRCRRVVRWPLAQVDGGRESMLAARTVHTPIPPPPRIPRIPRSTWEPPSPAAPLSRHILSFATAQHVPQLHEHSLGGVKGSSETFNSPCADNSCFDCSTSTRLSKATGVFCYFIMIYALILLISLLKKVSEPHYYPSTERT